MTRGITRDGLMGSNRQAIAQGVMAVLDRLQDMPQEAQIVTSACLFALFARRFGKAASPAELLSLADRLMKDAEGYRTEFAAAGAYMREEWQTA